MTEPQAPNCWRESGEAIADGQFSIHVDTQIASSAELLLALRLAQGTAIQPTGFPLASVELNQLIIHVEGRSTDRRRGARAELIAAVSRELSSLLVQVTAATITCVPLSFPARN